MHLPPGSELWLVGLAAFALCLVVGNIVSRRADPPSFDELEETGAINGIRIRRTAARRRR